MGIGFVVIDNINEEIFGAEIPNDPYNIQVLRGATEGTYPLPFDKSRIRPARKSDFAKFRVSPTGYEDDPAYDFPTE